MSKHAQTHDEIVEDLHRRILTEWEEEDRELFFLTEWNDNTLGSYHHSLGRWIRNNYNLWTIPWEPELRNGIDYSPYHPDAVSMKIIELAWLKGRGPIKE